MKTKDFAQRIDGERVISPVMPDEMGGSGGEEGAFGGVGELPAGFHEVKHLAGDGEGEGGAVALVALADALPAGFGGEVEDVEAAGDACGLGAVEPGEAVFALGEAEVEDGVDAGVGELGGDGGDLGFAAGDAVEGEGEVVFGGAVGPEEGVHPVVYREANRGAIRLKLVSEGGFAGSG